ncbi:MAG: hypothetical protein IPG54_15135 [Sphingomonadales bacterium]|nr:hypothetical protein [Sphingomonadales bacterium]
MDEVGRQDEKAERDTSVFLPCPKIISKDFHNNSLGTGNIAGSSSSIPSSTSVRTERNVPLEVRLSNQFYRRQLALQDHQKVATAAGGFPESARRSRSVSGL